MTEQQIELQMRVFNERIGETERTLEWLYEQRREFINRYNLNKQDDKDDSKNEPC